MKALETIVERLVGAYDPENIVLFGSRVSEPGQNGGDIDLLIVKETDRRPLDRRIQVERLLSDRQVPLDLFVYTPKELLQLYADGSPFIEEVVETGRVLYMRKMTAVWLEEAGEEYEIAVILYDHSKYRGCCFHGQQCAEKALKTLLIERAKRPARTHDLVVLHNAVATEGWDLDFPMDDAVYLNSIYRGRYPAEEGLLPHGERSREDAERALRSAERVLHGVKALLEAD